MDVSAKNLPEKVIETKNKIEDKGKETDLPTDTDITNVEKTCDPPLKKIKDNRSEHNSSDNVGRSFTDTFKTILSSVLKTDLGQVLKNRSDKSSLNKGNFASKSNISLNETPIEETKKSNISQNSPITLKSVSNESLKDDDETPSSNSGLFGNVEEVNSHTSTPNSSLNLSSEVNENNSELASLVSSDKTSVSKENFIEDSINVEDDIADNSCADSESFEKLFKPNKARKSVAKVIEEEKLDGSKYADVSNTSEGSLSTPSGQNRRRNYNKSSIVGKPANSRAGKRKIRQFKGGTYPLSIKPKKRRKKNYTMSNRIKKLNNISQMENVDVNEKDISIEYPAEEINEITELNSIKVDNDCWSVDEITNENKTDINVAEDKQIELKEHDVNDVPESENIKRNEMPTENSEIKLEPKEISNVMIAPSTYGAPQKNEVQMNSNSKLNKETNEMENKVDVKVEKSSFGNQRIVSPTNSEASEFHLEMSASSRTSVSMAGEDFEDMGVEMVEEEEADAEAVSQPPSDTNLAHTKNEDDVELPSGQPNFPNALESAKNGAEKIENEEEQRLLSSEENNEKSGESENIVNSLPISDLALSPDNLLKPCFARVRDAKGKFSRVSMPHCSDADPDSQMLSSDSTQSSMIAVNSEAPPRRKLPRAKPRKFTFFRNKRRFLLSRNRKKNNKNSQHLPPPDNETMTTSLSQPEENIMPASVSLLEENNTLTSVQKPEEFALQTEENISTDILPTEGRMSVALSVKRRHGLKRRREEDEFDSYSPLYFDPLLPRRARKASSVVSTFGKASAFSITQNDLPKPSLQLCTCQENCSANDTPILKETYCQAIDCIDDRLIGCCNLVTRPLLNRPSRTIPFVAMCEVHRFRLRAHHCCPGCGFFCTQGPFVKCSNESAKTWHLFHERCCLVYDGEALCPHCGCMSDWIHVRLRISGIRPNVYYPKQQHMNKQPSARMTITRGNEIVPPGNGNEENPSKIYRISQTGKEISLDGLPFGPDRSQLETLLINLALEKPMNLRYTIKSMYNAAKSNDVEKILHMLAMGFDPNHKFEEHDNETAIHAACANGHLVIVHVLHQAGAYLDGLDNKLRTPLMIAVENKQTAVIQYLIRSGVHLETRGEDGMTVLHLASKAGNLDACEKILETGKININIQDDGGWTPVVWAAEHRHKEIARFLLESGSDPNIRDNEHNIALHWAAFSGSLEICEMLLNRGCDLSSVNEHGDTPLHIASRQDNYDCVILFLARNADINVKNKENEIPLNCCPDENSQTWMALSMNSKLKLFAQSRKSRSEILLHKDISKGNESNPIPCVNGFDDEPYPVDYLYIVENCETSPINVDRSITSLQSCHCEEDCTSINCTCSSLSLKCWYTREGGLIPEFNLLDPPMIFECNRACRCWKNCNNRVVQQGIACRLQLFRTNGKGWGVRTLRDIPRGTFICEYIGEVISDSEADHREDDSYLFDLDNRDGETYCIDARHYGNISRFINHLCEPNLVPVKVFIDHQDLRFPRIAFFSSRDIKAYEELGFDYGEKFWIIKYKTFTCMCDSEKCKYSADKIQEMLENYMRRQKEEVEA